MSDIPPQVQKIADQLANGVQVKRRSLETFLSFYKAKKRGKVVTSRIKTSLLELGLETKPDFAECKVGEYLDFLLIDEKRGKPFPGREANKSERATSKQNPATASLVETILPTSPTDEISGDCLEPERDDEPVDQHAPQADDAPVISQSLNWSIDVLRSKKNRGVLDLQPSFQRLYVWEQRPELPSRLIESMLLKIPIPPIYLGQLSGGKLEVIDGQQRLTTLINFVNNEFTLKKLERLPSLNDKRFADLSPADQEKIIDTNIHVVIIDSGGRGDLRYEIFERLNRGSMPLNEQEIRNCVYRGPFNELLAKLEKDSKWRAVRGGEEPEDRFREREIILRFFAFANRLDFYQGKLKRFLNEYMKVHAPNKAELLLEQERMFRQTMQNVWTVFGKHSGRLYNIPSEKSQERDGRWDTKFSIAALEIQASALRGQDSARVQKVADEIQEHYLFLILNNVDVQNAISKATGGTAATKLRWTAFKSVIQPLLNNVDLEPRFFSVAVRRDLYEKSNTCAICNNTIHSFEDSVVDHNDPYSNGGRTVRENARLAHRSCNAIKNAKIPEDIVPRPSNKRRG